MPQTSFVLPLEFLASLILPHILSEVYTIQDSEVYL